MSIVLLILAWIVALLGSWLGVLLTAITLPGTWIALLSALVAKAIAPTLIETNVLIAIAGIAVTGELIEFFASAAGSKRAGGSRSAAVMSIVGAVVGLILGSFLIPIPILGTILGAIAGAGIGAGLAERGIAQKGWGQSWRVGAGAAKGRAFSLVLKTICCLLMAIIVTVDLFWN